MLKSTKIILAAISVTIVVCIVIVGVSIGVYKKKESAQTTVSEISSSYFDLENTTQSQSVSTTEATTQPKTLSQQLIGAWMDSADMSGFEFFENGKVKVTFINITIPFLDLPINGSANGTYTIDGTTLTMKYSIYSHTETRIYTASITDNELTLVSVEDNNISTYQRVDSLPEQSDSSSSLDINGDLTGSWISSDLTLKYKFNTDSSVNVTLNNAKFESVSNEPLSGTYNGIYLCQNNKLIIQFTVNGNSITKNYTYTVTTNSLSLTDENAVSLLFVREGTGGSMSSSADAENLIGSWKDSLGSSGYKFYDGGIVEITYVDFVVPVINMPINGKFKGTYTVNGDELTLRYSAVGKSITSVYSFEVNGNTLTLTDKESGKTSSYMATD